MLTSTCVLEKRKVPSSNIEKFSISKTKNLQGENLGIRKQ